MKASHGHHHAPAPHDAHSHQVVFDSPEVAADAELEGDVLVGFVEEASSAMAELCEQLGVEVGRLVDLGCGPGVGTCWLADRFDSATVVAVDGSSAMLERARARADRLGVSSRVETRHVDLATELASIDGADAVWASMVLHHVGDEAAALRQIGGLLRPGGLCTLIEHAGPVRILPADVDLGRPGIWERLDLAWAAWFRDMRADLAGTAVVEDYSEMLEAAGFELLVDRVLTVVHDAPVDDQAWAFAQRQIRRTSAQLAHHAEAADLAALDGLAEEAEVGRLRRSEVTIRASRHLYIARH